MSRIHKPNECFSAKHTYIMNHVVIEPVKRCVPKKAEVTEVDVLKDIEDIIDPYKEAQERANQLIADAEYEANNIILNAKEQAELIMNDARQSAYEQGLEQGKIEGLEHFKAAENEVKSIICELIQQKNTLLSDLEPQILKFSISIAEKIIDQQIVLDNTKFLSIISTAIQKASATEKITITVCPEEYNKVLEWKNLILSQSKNIKVIDVIEDEFLNSYDCLVDTDCGVIDAGVSSQIEKIKQAFELEESYTE